MLALLLGYGLAAKIAGAISEIIFILAPPLMNEFRLRPGQALIRIHFHIFVFGIFSRTGFKAFRPFAIQIVVSKIDTGDHRK